MVGSLRIWISILCIVTWTLLFGQSNSKPQGTNSDIVTLEKHSSISRNHANRIQFSKPVLTMGRKGNGLSCGDMAIDKLEKVISSDTFGRGAVELSDLNGWCSSNGGYTTEGVVGDEMPVSCWAEGPYYNRWFTFTAISERISIEVQSGGDKGTVKNIQLALWDAKNGVELACNKCDDNKDNVTLSYSSLIVGNPYYISVGNNGDESSCGTFTLCTDNMDERYYSISDGAWDCNTCWSKSGHDGKAAGGFPEMGDVAYISGNEMAIDNLKLEYVAEINLDLSKSNTSLAIYGATINKLGKVLVSNIGENSDGSLKIINSDIGIDGDLIFQRVGGYTDFNFEIANSIVTVGNNILWDVKGGVVTKNNFKIVDGSIFNIAGGLEFNVKGSANIDCMVDNAVLSVAQDVRMSASAANKIKMEFYNNALFKLKGDIDRGETSYGGIIFNEGTSLLMNGTDNPQILVGNTENFVGDSIIYYNIIVNNRCSDSPYVSLSGDLSLQGTLMLVHGIVRPSGSGLLIMGPKTDIVGGSLSSYIEGPIKKIGSEDFTFQIGKNGVWAPLKISNLRGDGSTAFTVNYYNEAYPDVKSIKLMDPNGTLRKVSPVEYWDLKNTGSQSTVDITLYWNDENRSQINDYNELVVAHYNGAEWENLGHDKLVIGESGSITVNGVSNYSPFTFGFDPGIALPVELIDLSVEVTEGDVLLTWQTATEVNNNYFEVQRSIDSINFVKIGKVPGAGNSGKNESYEFQDKGPIKGKSYYRLVHVNFEGASYNSTVVSVYIPEEEEVLIDVYPNPIGVKSRLIFYLPTDNDVRIDVVNVLGGNVGTLAKGRFNRGANAVPLSFDKANFQKGVYMVNMYIGEDIHTKRIIIQ